MEIKIEINDKDFTQFAQKTAELGIDPLDTIELIITKSLNERNLKSSIIREEKPKNHVEELFVDFENKMKKYNIHQSSIAYYLQTTQASISRALKSKKDNTLLFEQINLLHDKLLIYAYIYQYGAYNYLYDIECKSLSEKHISIFNIVATKIETNLDSYFSENVFQNIICDFVKTEFFQKVDFEKIYSNIDQFIETVNEFSIVLKNLYQSYKNDKKNQNK